MTRDFDESRSVRMSKKPYWIKERYNPQLGTYYVAYGQMSKTAARKCEGSIYGNNVMRKFDSETEYNLALGLLKHEGKSVQ